MYIIIINNNIITIIIIVVAIQSLYVENKILIEAGKLRTAPRVGRINCGVRPVSYTHLDVYKRQI